jgi:hypothetical protein
VASGTLERASKQFLSFLSIQIKDSLPAGNITTILNQGETTAMGATSISREMREVADGGVRRRQSEPSPGIALFVFRAAR